MDNRAGPERSLIYSIRNPLLDEVRFELRHGDGSIQRLQLGDRVLIGLVQRLSDMLRSSDVLGCIGGEEFVVLMPNTDAPTAESVAERCRQAIAENIHSGAESLPVTVSIGVAVWRAGVEDRDGLIARADAALYQAKSGGRNRVCLGPALPIFRRGFRLLVAPVRG